MMISEEMYYEYYLKDKSKDEIMKSIRSLKQDLGHLKNVLENQRGNLRSTIYPSEEVRILWTRKYLALAIKAYEESGEIYPFSQKELKIADFENNLKNISKITLSVNKSETYIIEISDLVKGYKIVDDKQEVLSTLVCNKDDFIASLKAIYIGEWKRTYKMSRFDDKVVADHKWYLEFEYNNTHKNIKYEGSNSYPYNFNELRKLLTVNKIV